MSDSDALLLTLAALYLLECIAWVGRGSFPFRGMGATRCRPVNTAIAFGNDHGVFVLKNPLPPFGLLFESAVWPVLISNENVVAAPSLTPVPGSPADAGAACAALSEFKTVAAEGAWLRLNGARWARAADAASAQRAAKLLRRLAGLPLERRGAALADAIGHAFDRDAVKQRYDAWRRIDRPLRVACHLLFTHVFLVAPLVILILGLISHWHWLLAGLAGLQWTIIVLFWRGHRSLFAAERGERYAAAARMLLLPLAAIRAPDALARHLFAGFHPLAVAAVCCGPDVLREFAGSVLRDLHAQSDEGAVTVDDGAARVGRVPMIRAVERLLGGQGIAVADLLAPPAPSAPDCVAYCPRCLTQFVNVDARCEGCGRIQSLRLAGRVLPGDESHSAVAASTGDA